MNASKPDKSFLMMKDFLETINLRDLSETRDFSYCGIDVVPTTKQQLEVDSIYNLIVETAFESKEHNKFNLNEKLRILISNCIAEEIVNDSKNSNKRYLFLFNDLILLTKKVDDKKNSKTNVNTDKYELINTLNLNNIQVHDFYYDDFHDSYLLEIYFKSESSRKNSIRLKFDNLESKVSWVKVLENTLIGYHYRQKNNKFSEIGWVHTIILGTIYSAAYRGNLSELSKHLNWMAIREVSIDTPDEFGMSALHWACYNGNDMCVKVLTERGAKLDCLQSGMNSPLLLASSKSHVNVIRLLTEKGANIMARNISDRDALGMAILFGHTHKSFPWAVQLLIKKGIDPCQPDLKGQSLMHLAVERGIVEAIRVLHENGVHIESINEINGLSPLLFACCQPDLDVEVIRMLLSKGAKPNLLDLKNRRMVDAIIMDYNPSYLNKNQFHEKNKLNYFKDNTNIDENNNSVRSPSPDIAPSNNRQQSIEEVGDWVVQVLPSILELVKNGARYDENLLNDQVNGWMRSSFRTAIHDAKLIWINRSEPQNFTQFVQSKEKFGIKLFKNQNEWIKDNSSSSCQFCNDKFSMKLRRHHCRSCGLLCCTDCSSKRLSLSSKPNPHEKDDLMNSNSRNSILSFRSSTIFASDQVNNPNNSKDRVCDSCFNMLCNDHITPSFERKCIKQLKNCTVDLISNLKMFLDSLNTILNDPDTSNVDSNDLFLNSNQILKRTVSSVNEKASESENISSPVTSIITNETADQPYFFNDNFDDFESETIDSSVNILYKVERSISKFVELSTDFQDISSKLASTLYHST